MAVETVMQSGTDHPRALDNHNPPETTLKRSNPSLIHFDEDVFVKFWYIQVKGVQVKRKFKMKCDRREVILFDPKTILEKEIEVVYWSILIEFSWNFKVCRVLSNEKKKFKMECDNGI